MIRKSKIHNVNYHCRTKDATYNPDDGYVKMYIRGRPVQVTDIFKSFQSCELSLTETFFSSLHHHQWWKLILCPKYLQPQPRSQSSSGFMVIGEKMPDQIWWDKINFFNYFSHLKVAFLISSTCYPLVKWFTSLLQLLSFSTLRSTARDIISVTQRILNGLRQNLSTSI